MKKKASGFGIAAVLLLLFVLLLIAGILAVCVGRYEVTPQEVLDILWCRLWGTESRYDAMTVNVVMELRVPRIFSSILVGAALALSGAAYQGIFCNPLISPDFLGVSGGACVGAAVAILLSLPGAGIQLLAFLGGIAAVALAMTLPMLFRDNSNIILVLSGIIVGAAMSSVMGFIKYTADPETQLAAITYWTMGSFGYISLGDLLSVLPMMLVSAAVLFALSWRIDLLSLGEQEAQALGINVKLCRGIIILCATLLTASSVCLAGTISWVGLVIPHLGRMLMGPNNAKLLPVSALLGGLFMLVVDTLTRTIGAAEMPISILTGIVGAPFYVWLLWRQRRGRAL